MSSTTSTEHAGRIEHLTTAERAAKGKAARSEVSRSSHGDWAPAADRPDPLGLLTAQEASRVPELVPIRHSRMAASPFAFYRGAANVLAADLAAVPHTSLKVQLCGDAHLVNFGGFASPERNFVFDINDFDETHPGPFEWDVKRLAASIEIAARSRGFDRKTRTRIVSSSVRSYREAMRGFAGMQNLDLWYAQLDIAGQWGQDLGGQALKSFQRTVEKAQSKDRLKAESKLTHLVDGEPRFLSDPPLLVPAEDLFADSYREQLESTIRVALRSYRHTLQGDRRRLLESYRYVQLARKVVGVGSVGTRCWVVLMVGLDNSDPLFLQVKEAEASVLESHLGASGFANHGQRVVEGQRLMQAASDIFLGWQRVDSADSVDGRAHDYYMRQLWDWKASADVDTMSPELLDVYGQICGWTLARGHARSGDRVAIASYLGSSASFDQAIARFAALYAEQNDLDHQSLTRAIADGTMPAEAGI